VLALYRVRVETLRASCGAFEPFPGRYFFALNTMRFCYLDESGVPELNGGTSHFVLLGMSVIGESWKSKDTEITNIKRRYGLEQEEIHSGWIARRYVEQEKIKDFESLSSDERRKAVLKSREALLVKKAAVKGLAAVQDDRKNFKKTEPYIHLTLSERRQLLQDIVDLVHGWNDCQLFAECTDKTTFRVRPPTTPPFEEAFEQVISRFHAYLNATHTYGLIVQDQNESVVKRLTELMRKFHRKGTRWTDEIRYLVETPLFVDSSLTSMVQVADLCAYATRRFCENNEIRLFDPIFSRFCRSGTKLVGIRHYTNRMNQGGRICHCQICK
jgi:hypothetical protein